MSEALCCKPQKNGSTPTRQAPSQTELHLVLYNSADSPINPASHATSSAESRAENHYPASQSNSTLDPAVQHSISVVSEAFCVFDTSLDGYIDKVCLGFTGCCAVHICAHKCMSVRIVEATGVALTRFALWMQSQGYSLSGLLLHYYPCPCSFIVTALAFAGD